MRRTQPPPVPSHASGATRRGDRVRRREFIFFITTATAAWPLTAPAEQSGKVYRVGVLSAGADASNSELAAVSRDAFQKLGWFEGKNIISSVDMRRTIPIGCLS